MLQTSLLLIKSLNKTETPIFKSVVCSLFPKAIFFTDQFVIKLHMEYPCDKSFQVCRNYWERHSIWPP